LTLVEINLSSITKDVNLTKDVKLKL
jgi:hypothetical protein